MELLQSVLDRYAKLDYIQTEEGHIIWRRGTGDNVELLDIQVHDPKRREGHGTELFKNMLHNLIENPPFSDVFGFTRSCNKRALNFYQSLGFKTQYVNGIYKDGSAIIFSQKFESLLERNHVKKNR